MFPSWVVGHPNIRLFISHTGGLSTQEACYHGVPVLGVPFMVDQFHNVEKVQRMGMGRKILYADITTKDFLDEIREMLHNSK